MPGQPEQRALSLWAGAQTSPAGADVHRGHRKAEGSAAGKDFVLGGGMMATMGMLIRGGGDHLEFG